MGATLPFTLIIWAGPVAILQASIVSIVTFLVIYWVGVRLGLDRRLAATLGAGGAVCGVSASIAIAGAVGAKKEDAPIAITLVIIWAIVMIFVLPFVAAALHLPAGVAGAWIGTSEFADAAGIAAAQAYGGLAGPRRSRRHQRSGVFAFTLMKVVGRDVWIGIWAFVLAIVATTRWERAESGRKPDAAQIWWRFPKFVIGFLVASLLVTAVTSGYSLADYNKIGERRLWSRRSRTCAPGLSSSASSASASRHASARLARAGAQAVPRVHRRRRGECGAGLHPVGLGIRRALVESRPVRRRRRRGSDDRDGAVRCAYFRNSPAFLEIDFPGMSAISSAWGSTGPRMGSA